MKLRLPLLLASIIIGGTISFGSNSTNNTDIPIKKVTLYSSGVGYFQHQGSIEWTTRLVLPFERSALNDVLKSITIYDPDTNLPTISYPSEETVQRTLDSLSVNLGNNPSIVDILNSLRGADVKIFASREITGKIIGANTKKIKVGDEIIEDATLSILTEGRIQVIKTDEITYYTFEDPKINEDMNRALDLILTSKNTNIKNINVNLSGDNKRDIELSYVIASPVWKATYRFDLGSEKPYLQGWAIVDNVGEMDWTDVELSLVTGRPVSFIQELYAPFHLQRPTIPLSIAGVAVARTYDSGFMGVSSVMAVEDSYYSPDESREIMDYRQASFTSIRNSPAPVTNTRNAGDMFVFTSPTPITLERQQSAMIPLVQSTFVGQKISIFDGANARQDTSTNLALGVKFINDSGMKLPAGPITMYDDDTYVGDALLEFLPENDTRMVSYGDDLSVTGIISVSQVTNIDSITIVDGILNMRKRDIYERVYNFQNTSENEKNLIIEHPFIQGSTLVEPQVYEERTGTLYRFDTSISGNEESQFSVKEEVISEERIVISNLGLEDLLSYSTNGDIPEDIREISKKAAQLYSEINNTNSTYFYFETNRNEKIEEQDRIRKNIEAVGSDSTQGKEYVKKLVKFDEEIEDLNKKMKETVEKIQELRKNYSDFILSLKMEVVF